LGLAVSTLAAQLEHRLAEVAAATGFDCLDTVVALGGAASKFVFGQRPTRVGSRLVRQRCNERFDVAVASRRGVANEAIVMLSGNIDLHHKTSIMRRYRSGAIAITINWRMCGVDRLGNTTSL
jgi:hypothetical protein